MTKAEIEFNRKLDCIAFSANEFKLSDSGKSCRLIESAVVDLKLRVAEVEKASVDVLTERGWL